MVCGLEILRYFLNSELILFLAAKNYSNYFELLKETIEKEMI